MHELLAAMHEESRAVVDGIPTSLLLQNLVDELARMLPAIPRVLRASEDRRHRSLVRTTRRKEVAPQLGILLEGRERR